MTTIVLKQGCELLFPRDLGSGAVWSDIQRDKGGVGNKEKEHKQNLERKSLKILIMIE